MESGFSLAYASNLWSHHQSPIAFALHDLLGGHRFSYCVVESPVPTMVQERSPMGWKLDAIDLPWTMGPPLTKEEQVKISRHICEADVAVLGAVPRWVSRARIRTGKPTFFMEERMDKLGRWPWSFLHPRQAAQWIRARQYFNRPNVCYLPIGLGTSSDARRAGLFKGAHFLWGYFTAVSDQRPLSPVNPKVQVLWAGRFLDWKQVHLIVRAANELRNHPVPFEVKLLGDGPERSKVEALVRSLELDHCISLLPSVAPDQVRTLMRQSDVYVLPSNRGEGWGAVVGEAMAEGCLVIANREAGASRVLIEHGESGLLFQDGNVAELAACLRMALEGGNGISAMRRRAWETMNEIWNPRVAAERLVELCSALLAGGPLPEFAQGPLRRV